MGADKNVTNRWIPIANYGQVKKARQRETLPGLFMFTSSLSHHFKTIGHENKLSYREIENKF